MRYLMYFVLPAVIMIPVGIYFYHFLKRIAGGIPVLAGRRAVRAALVLISAALVLPAANIWGFWAVVILHLFVLSLGVDLVHFILRKAAGTGEGEDSVREKVYRSGLIPVAGTCLILLYGFWNMGHVVEKDYTVYTDKEIRGEGYRIALISDLHYGTTMDGDKLREICKRIGERRPDLVVLCGDIVDERTTAKQMTEAVAALGGIPRTFGTCYVFGNHDRADYVESPAFTGEELEQTMEAHGITVLSDTSVRINGELTVVGREDRSFFGDAGRLSGQELLTGLDLREFLLLLDHQPCELEENRRAGYDLQLSGHTHAGQIWPVGLVSGLLGFGEMNYGYKDWDGFQVIVSSGIAGWGYPVRTGAHSEYVIVDLQNSGKEPDNQRQ